MKKTLLLLTYLCLSACSDTAEKQVLPVGSPLEGKVKTIAKTIGSNKITTEWLYDLTTKVVTGFKTTDSLAKTTKTEKFVRDANGLMATSNIEIVDDKNVKTAYTKMFSYTNGKIAKTEYELAGYKYIEEFKYNNEQLATYNNYTLQVSNSRKTTLLTCTYEWIGKNVDTFPSYSVNGSEEESYNFNKDINLIGKILREEVKLPLFMPEDISENVIGASVRIFSNAKFKYTYAYDTTNRLIKQTITKVIDQKLYQELSIVYYGAK